MRENEIVKALERMREEDPDGFSSDVLGVINRQKAEKEELDFEFIRTRNEMEAWKIRANWYKEKSSKLECKNSELEIELKAMRGAANSYKSEVERLQKENKSFSCLGMLYSEIKSEARKEFWEQIKAMYGLDENDIIVAVNIKDIDDLLAGMESEGE